MGLFGLGGVDVVLWSNRVVHLLWGLGSIHGYMLVGPGVDVD